MMTVCFAVLFCVGISIFLPHKRYEGIIRIVCGIFVISAVASPVPGILKIGYEKVRIENYLADSDGFFEKIRESEESYTQHMQENFVDIVKEEFQKEISRVFGFDAKVDMDSQSGTVIIEDAPHEKREEIKEYVNTNYSMDTLFCD